MTAINSEGLIPAFPSNCAGPFKEQMGGIFNPFGWGAYFRRGHRFIKKAKVEKNARYPDFGCNFEVYTDTHSLELETLGPLRKLRIPEGYQLERAA